MLCVYVMYVCYVCMVCMYVMISISFQMVSGRLVSMSVSHAIGRGFAPLPGHTKDSHKNGTNCLSAWHASYSVGV